MAALLYRSLTIARMWALLEASTDFTDIVKQARRIEDTSEGWLKKLVLRSVGDFPHVQIEMGDNFSGSGPAFTVLANEGAAPTADWTETRGSDFKMSFIYESPGFDKQDVYEMSAMEALEAGGRNLGYTPIKLWGPWKAKRNAIADPFGAEGVVRPVTQIIIPVSYEFTGSQL